MPPIQMPTVVDAVPIPTLAVLLKDTGTTVDDEVYGQPAAAPPIHMFVVLLADGVG